MNLQLMKVMIEIAELHIINIFKIYEVQQLNNTHFYGITKCDCTKYIN